MADSAQTGNRASDKWGWRAAGRSGFSTGRATDHGLRLLTSQLLKRSQIDLSAVGCTSRRSGQSLRVAARC
jgi:hypothetical protein